MFLNVPKIIGNFLSKKLGITWDTAPPKILTDNFLIVETIKAQTQNTLNYETIRITIYSKEHDINRDLTEKARRVFIPRFQEPTPPQFRTLKLIDVTSTIGFENTHPYAMEIEVLTIY